MQPITIIAEAGVNHNGRIEHALDMVDVASDAGADIIKFQTFIPSNLASKHANKADYQQEHDATKGGQLEMLRQLVLTPKDYESIIERCQQRNIEFLSTPFDQQSLQFLVNDLGLKQLKIGSGDITDGPLLLSLAQQQCDVILSTGMSTLTDIECALSVLAYGYLNPDQNDGFTSEAFMSAYASPEGQAILQDKVTLLHCVSAYPAPVDQLNLYAIDTLRDAFVCPVGYSDHSLGIHIPSIAATLGATLIEKHFTLDKSMPGPDHQMSICPQELTEMIKQCRDIPKALGTGLKIPSPDELQMRAIARKSLVTSRDVEVGELIAPDTLIAKRPGYGVSPMQYWNRIGKLFDKSMLADDLVT